MEEPPRLDIAIASYRCADLLRECLASLAAHPAAGGMRVHVVDNDSRDATVEVVEREFPSVVLTEAGSNLGFAAATNIAIENGSAPYVLALNPDTRVMEGTLDRLLAVMESMPEVGVCGPKLVRDDGSLDHAAKRQFPTILGALGHFTRLGRSPDAPGGLAQYRAPDLDPDQPGPVDAVNGAFMLMRRAALESVGRFDEGYWMYMEDLDLCYRMAQAGWVTWYEPAATAVHIKGGTTQGRRSLRLNYAFHYGMFRFYRAHYAPCNRRLLNAVVYGGIGAKFALAVIREPFRGSNAA